MQKYDYKRGLPIALACYLIWGFQSLYFYLCKDIDTVFLLASRIVWASLACLAILKVQGKLVVLKNAFRDRKLLLRETGAMFFLLADWGVYLWAVQRGRVMECSLGYYIQPIVVFAFGALIFHERMTWKHIAILLIIAVGIVLSARGFGGLPWVTILLALLFSFYAAIKKSLTLDPVVSTTLEILLMLPAALVTLFLFYRGENGLAGLNVPKLLLLAGSGIITAAPMLLYSVAVKKLPLMTIGICQYMSPTFGIICGTITGEALTKEKLISFVFVWIGVILYTANMFSERKEYLE